MPKLMYKDKEYSGSSATTAKQLDYNNTDSNLDATNAQDAIDEIKEIVDGKAEEVHKHKVSDISDLTATATELNYMDGVTSGVQGQINTLNDKIVSNTNEISALNSDIIDHKEHFQRASDGCNVLKSDVGTIVATDDGTQYSNIIANDFSTQEGITLRNININMDANLGYIPLFGTTKGAGLLTNALAVDLTTVENNKVAYVCTGHTSNIPTDCSHGIREVLFYNTSAVFVKITGSDIMGRTTTWQNLFNGTMWTGWERLSTISDLNNVLPRDTVRVGSIGFDEENELYITIDNKKYRLHYGNM